MIIGDINHFAVEYSFSAEHSKDMGYGKIWIGNTFIGTNNDLIYLNGYLLKTLNEFAGAKELESEIKHLKKNELFRLFRSGKYRFSDSYLVRGATFTDDFSIWCYKIDDLTYILWKVLNTDFFEDLNDYPKDVFLKSINTVELDNVITLLKNEFVDIGILKHLD